MGSEEVEGRIVAKPSFGMTTRLCIIAGLLLAVGCAGIWVATTWFEADWRLLLVAMGVCVISSLVAHVVGEYPRGDDYFAARMALSLAARTAPPFLLVIIVKLNPSLPFGAAFVLYIVLLYLIGLVVDVQLHVSRLKSVEA